MTTCEARWLLALQQESIVSLSYFCVFGAKTALVSPSVLRHGDLDKDISPPLVKTISRQDAGSNMPGETRPSLSSFLLHFLYIVSLLTFPFSRKSSQQQDQINAFKECCTGLQMPLLFVLQ